MSQDENDVLIRQAVQTAVASVSNKNSWQNTVLAVVGICTLGGAIVTQYMDGKTDQKLAPLKQEMALMKQDSSYVKRAVDDIKDLIKAQVPVKP